MNISFRTVGDGSVLEFVDRIERRRLSMTASSSVVPEAVSADDTFPFPVDAAVRIETSEVTIPEGPAGYVRAADGALLSELVRGTAESFPEGTYFVELDVSIKIYVRIEGPLEVTADSNRLELDFGGERAVSIGARSYHQRPAATIETSADPLDLFAAVSEFGSALKTTSCERSYPTLRGHPPTLRLGEELSIPDGLSTPDTGVRLELPPTRAAAFVAAPLSYYLCANCVPASRPRIVTDSGFEYYLDTERGFEAEVARVLERTFFLDCLTRTEGHYRIPLHERAAVEPLVDLEFEALYGAPLAEQLEAYLSVPYDVLEPHLPQWALVADLPPKPNLTTVLPFVVDDLAIVRTAGASRLSPSEVRPTVLRQHMLDSGDGPEATDRDDRRTTRTDGHGTAGSDGPDETSIVRPTPADSVEQVWFGDGVPIGASKGTEAAYRHRLDRTAREGNIRITVVCNGDIGTEERAVVEEVYGSHEQLPFDVTLRRDLSADALARALESDTDFFHYVGHIDDDGFECSDGRLDATTMDRIGAYAFFLNACRSYRQGMALVERGSVGGVVTFADVIDSGAIRIGQTMTRLLDRGFPLQSAFTIARSESVVAGNYLIVGDGTVDVVQARHGAPVLCELASDDETGYYELTVRAYLPAEGGMGTLAFPYVGDNDEYFLPPGELATFRLSEPELREYVTGYGDPIRKEGELLWPERPEDRERLITDRE